MKNHIGEAEIRTGSLKEEKGGENYKVLLTLTRHENSGKNDTQEAVKRAASFLKKGYMGLISLEEKI